MRDLDKELSNAMATAVKALRGLSFGAVLTLVLCAALAIAGIYAATTINSDIPMSGAGKIAMVIGVVVTLLVGVGLMSLVFFSSRHGYDDDSTLESDEDSSR